MKTYREYAKNNGLSDSQVEANVGSLFGADAEMEMVSDNTYKIGSYLLHTNPSAADVVELIDDDGEILENWTLDA